MTAIKQETVGLRRDVSVLWTDPALRKKLVVGAVVTAIVAVVMLLAYIATEPKVQRIEGKVKPPGAKTYWLTEQAD